MNKQIATIHTSIRNRANLSWTAAIVALVAIVVGVAWPTSLAAQDQPSLELSSLSVTDQNGTTVSIGTFDPATTTYSGSVDSIVERIKIDAIASAGSSADVQTIPRDSQPGTPGHQVELSHGTNLILVSVDSYSIDAVLKTYAVQIIRGGASGTANVVSINGGDYRAREGSTVPFLLTRTGDTTQALTVQIEISERYNDKVPTFSEGLFDVEFKAGHASARHDVDTLGDSLARGSSSVEGRVRSGSGYTVGTNSDTLVWQVWDDDYGQMNLESIVVNDMASSHVDIGTFDPAEKSYSATVASTEEYVTVSAPRPAFGGWGTFIDPGDSKPDISGHQVALSHGTNLIVVGVYSVVPGEKEIINAYELKIERSGTATVGSPITVGVNVPNTGREGAMLPFLLTRTGDTSQSLTVQFDVTETGGDMVSSMYEGQKEVEFLAGEAFAKHYIGTMADEVWEEHSTVRVEVKVGTGYQVSQSVGSASTLVEDNDLPDMTAVLTLDSTEVDEGDQITATITVTTDGPQIPHEHAGTLVIKTTSGTAGKDDFELNGDTNDLRHLHLHAQGAFKPVETAGDITAFQAKTSVTVEILDDYRAEPDEIFYVQMKDYVHLRTDAVTMDPDNTKHTVTIRGEDETPPAPSEAGYATVVVTDSGTTGSAFTISWHDPVGCDSNYSARLMGAFAERWLIGIPYGVNGKEFSVGSSLYQDIGSTSPENTEIVGTLEYISTTIYLEDYDRYVHSDGLSVIVDCVDSHVVAEVPLPSQAADTVERTKPGTYSSEAPLTGLTISSGTLSPVFNKDGFLYSVLDVPNENEQVTFTATAKSDYSISWDPVTDADPDTDGHQVDIEVGYNTIYVTADHDEGLLSFVYEVIVKRAEESMMSGQRQAEATLRDLSLSGIKLSFDPATTEYTVEVEDGVTETTVTPTPNDPGSTFVIKLDGVEDSDGTVSLSAGSNVITVEVTAANKVTNQTYTVTITRPTSISAQDSLPTGWPTISGTAQVGETLTVDTSGIADADGLTNVSYSYQWIRNYGTSDTNIAGATDATYTLVAADAGKIIKVRVTFTDDAGNGESLTSAATEEVSFAVQQQVANTPATGLPTISGTAQVGETLTAETSAIDDADGLVNVSFSYQWERQNLATGTWTTWTASATTYVLTSDDRDSAVRVSVSFSDDAGNDETLSSYWLLVLTSPNNPATGVPTISGAAQVGETLTAETSGIADADGLDDATFAYQWLADDANIAGATAATYTVNAADEGRTIRVSVTFTDDAGHEQTLTSAATELVQPRPAPGSPPDAPNQPEGTAVFVGGVNLEWNDVPDADSYGVQMYRNGQWTDLPGDGIEIAFYGAGSIISELEPEGSSYWFRVRAGNAHGFSEWSDFNFMAPTTQSKSGRQARPDNTPASGEPVISGTAQVGETLTADTADVEDGNGLDRVQFRFQWVSHDGSADTDIANATDSTYTVVADEAGKTIKVRVAFTDRGGYAESLTSAATATVAAAPNSPATGAPAATGTAEVGETLTADTSGITDTNGLTNVSYNYQWVANDGNVDTDITDAMDSTYTLVSANEGKTIKVRVSFTDDDGNIESLTSGATEAVSFAVQPQLANNPATGAPTITGTAQAGETLAVDTSNISDGDGMVNVTFGYQWISNHGTTDTDITDETNPTYVIKPWDLGNYIKVRVSFSDNAGNKETLTSAPTSGVEKSPNHPAKEWLNLLGMAEVGQELRVVDVGLDPGWSLQDPNGLTYATFSYQWIRSDATTDVEIPNATGSSYTLVDADEGESIKVRVSFTDDGANPETLTSSATDAVTARPDTSDLSAPTALSVGWSRGEEKGNDLEWIAPEGTVTGYQILRLEIPTRSSWWEPYAHGCTPLMEVHVSDTGGDATTYTDTDVAEGASYTYSVRALNSDGVGRKSASPRSLQYRPPHVYSPSGVPTGSYWPSGAPGTPYRAPTNLVSSQIKNGIGLTWDAPEGEVTGYQILRRSPEQCDFGYRVYVENTNSTDTHWADRNVVSGTLYEYHIRAVNDVGVGRLDRDISTSLRPTTLVVGPGPNNPATGTPTVSGTAQVGETLIADPSVIVDADGIYWAAFEYQWLADDTEIDGATSTTYSIQASNANKAIKVRVDFMDDAGNEESLTSAATAAISPNISATGTPAITGTVELGETLTADTSGIEDEDGLDNVSFSYQWIHSDGTDDWDIVGATGTTYAITAADADKAIKLRVNFTDDKGSVESLTSSATVTVPIEVAFTFSIEGTTVNCDSWNVHVVNVPYEECDDPISTDQEANGEIDVEIEIARSVSSQLYKFDFGIYQVEDSLGNYGSNQANDLCLGPGLAESALLEVTPDDGTGPFTYTDDGTIFGLCDAGTYQLVVFWYRYNGEDEEYEYAGTFRRYFFITSNEEVDTSIEKVKWITALYSEPPFTHGDVEIEATKQSTVLNRELTTYSLTIDGLVPDSDPETTDYVVRLGIIGEWDGEVREVPWCHVGKVGYSYLLKTVPEDGEWAMEVHVLGSCIQNWPELLRIELFDGSDLTDYSVPIEFDGSYIVSETGELLYPEHGTYRFIAGKDIEFRPQPTIPEPNIPATREPTIVGTAEVGETLTVDTSGMSGTDGEFNVSFSYQWIANDGTADTNIAGATDSTYTLIANDAGKTIKVRVNRLSFTDDDVYTLILESAATEVVTFAVQRQVVNSPATGTPAISGTAQVGAILTAETSGISDTDGLANVLFSYQWIRNDGTSDTNIAGATYATYTQVEADEGQTIKVEVNFTDDAGNDETLTSGATSAVAASEPPAKPTGLTAIVSHNAVTLTWDDPQDDSITGYVILRRDRAIHPVGTFVTITGDTGSADTTYTDATVEPEKQYNYKIEAINEHGEVSERSHWVRANTPVVPIPNKPTGLSATVSHDAVTLTWDDPQDDAITGYVILRRDRDIHPGGTFVTIAGDTGSVDTTYTDDTVEPEKEYVYRIKAINEHGEVSERSHWVRGFTPAAPQPDSPTTGEPTITGTAQVGERLTADTSGISDDDGLNNAVFAYQWLSDDAEIGGATGSTYTLVNDDEGRTIKVRGTVTDDLGNETTLTSAATEAVKAAPQPDSPATGEPTITGTAQVGQTLTVDTSNIADADGLNNAVFAYQWLSDDAEIGGATGSTYTLVDDDEGRTIKVRVTVTDDLGNETTLTSAATEAVEAAPQPDSPATGEPTITGTAQVGQTLTVDTSGIADADGLESAVFAYQWLSDDAEISGATGSTYTLVDDEEGRTIKVRVTVTDDLGNETTLTSEATEAVEAAPQPDSPATGEPTITGTAQVGQTLGVDTSGIADADGLESAVFAYQWLSDDAETGGATGSTYTLVNDDEGRTIKVRVTVTDDLGNETTLTSEATEAVEAAPQPDSPATGEPTITGTAQVGQTLGVDTSGIADADGLESAVFAYQWLSDDAETGGATGSTYTLVNDDEGRTIKVRVTVTDDLGNETTLTSAATEPVEAKRNTAATGRPTISGTVRVGETLTADTTGIADADGLTKVSYKYQWVVTDLGAYFDIPGETGATYTLVAIDRGLYIQVRVSFTDDAGNRETLTSAETDVVVAAP